MRIIKLILEVLDDKSKKLAFLLLLASLMVVILELLSISAFLPIGNYISNKEVNLLFLDKLIKNQPYDILFLITAIFLTVFLFKFLFLLFFTFFKNYFTQFLTNNLTLRLYSIYLSQNYNYFKEKHSSYFVRNITYEVNLFLSAFNSIITIFLEASVVLVIIILMITVQPIETMIIFFFLLIFMVFTFIYTKPILDKWGKIRQESDFLKLKYLQETINSIKDLKIYRVDSFFKNKFSKALKLSTKSGKIRAILQEIPRHLIEILLIIAIVANILVLSILDYKINEIIGILSVYGVAALRLLPAFNKLLHNFQQLRYTTASAELINTEFKLFNLNLTPIKKDNNFEFKNIKLENVNFNFKDKKILKNINLQIDQGTAIGLFGESGSGKSTLLNILNGLEKINNGSFKINDSDFNDTNKFLFLDKVGYVASDTYILDDTIEKNITLSDEDINKELINKVIEVSLFNKVLDQNERDNFEDIGEGGNKLSSGQRQRLAIARALYRRPQVLFIDEGTNALDKASEILVLNNLKKYSLKQKMTLIMITHRTETLKIFDKIYEISDGNLEEKKMSNLN